MPLEPLPSKPPSPRPGSRMLASPYYRRSVLRPLLFAFLSILAIYTLYNQSRIREQTLHVQEVISEGLQSFYQTNRTHNNTLYQQGTEERVVKEFDFGQNPCAHFPDQKDTDGVLLVMKTGATEVFDKLPTHLLTGLQCLPDFLLFSDREQQIGQWHVYDALDNVSDEIKTRNPEFDLYRTQLECPVAQKACLDTYRGQSGTAAWSLDKYKFLHILQRSWDLRPNQTWYVFAEADTYVVWPNLVHWLRTRAPVQDPLLEPLYVGSAAMLAGVPFAHGGSGYVLSGALVRHIVEGHTDLAELYDRKARIHCCGDQMIAKAFLEREHLKVQNGHPMFNGEKPTTLPYGPTHWCDPVFTMHHMGPEEISAVWQYEQTRKDNGTLLMKDLYQAFVANKMVDKRAHWDNLSEDVCYIDPDPAVRNHVDDKMKRRLKKDEDLNSIEREAYKSLANCAKVCEYEGWEDVDEEIEVDDVEAQGLQQQQQQHQEEQPKGAEGGPAKQEAVNKQESGKTKRDGAPIGNPPQQSKPPASPGAEAAPAPPKKKVKTGKKVLKPTKVRKNPADRRCFQYRYQKGLCCTGKSFKLGTPRREAKGNAPDKPNEIWHSGWHLDYIEAWINAVGECEGPKWKVPDKL